MHKRGFDEECLKRLVEEQVRGRYCIADTGPGGTVILERTFKETKCDCVNWIKLAQCMIYFTFY
jgi:hypothetical protein